MNAVQPFARDDTFFGVCHALGEDLGFSPTLLRIPLALLLFVSPVAVLAGYVVAGVLIAMLRWFVPNPATAEAQPPLAAALPEQDNESVPDRLAA